MSQFTGSLIIEEVQPGRRWRLVEPIRYEVGSEGSGVVIEVPAGTETDGATIPAALRLMLAVWGTYGRAACIHDYLYSILRDGQLWTSDVYGRDVIHPAFQGLGPIGCSMLEYPSWARRWADQEFYLAMRACGTRPALAWIIWATVRLFGGRHIRPLTAAGD